MFTPMVLLTNSGWVQVFSVKLKLTKMVLLTQKKRFQSITLPEERSGITQRMARKTILFDKSKEKFLPTSDPIQLTQSQAHGPFRDHLALILLFDEPSCPKCGTNNDSNIHFTFDCIYYRKIRKNSLNIESKQQNTQNQFGITVTD